MGIGKRVTESLDEPAKKKAEETIYLPEEPKFSLEDIVLPAPLKEKILEE
ncbi:MAG: hypothetical protein IJG32_02465 [Selenomonadaceae bacterium]|nr:hypothetical protein [Selenomonadaceae bacterium]